MKDLINNHNGIFVLLCCLVPFVIAIIVGGISLIINHKEIKYMMKDEKMRNGGYEQIKLYHKLRG